MTREDFWSFVQERDAIRVRRESGTPPPWTTDPILSTYHFPNVHRRLDPGTKWFLDRARGSTSSSVLIRSYAYRSLNRLDLFKNVGLPETSPTGVRRWCAEVEAIRAHGHPIGSTRHQTFWSRVPRGLALLASYDLGPITSSRDGVEAVVKLCALGIGLGPFFAVQVVADLAEAGAAAFDRETEVPVSGGSRFGLDLTYGRAGPFGMVDSQYKGRDGRRLTVDKRELNDVRLLRDAQPRLSEKMTFIDLEHTLCEFGRYSRAKAGHLHNVKRRTW